MRVGWARRTLLSQNLVSNLELWRRDLALVCRFLIAFLGFLNSNFKFTMEFLKISD